MDSPLGSESRSSWATFIIDIWYFEEKNSKSARATPQNLRAVKSTKLLVYLTKSAVGVLSLQKKKSFSSQVPSGYLIFHMKWPGEAIWSIILPKNQRETEIFHFPFFSCFSPLSWLQVLELPWDHCVLTKKSFCIIQIDFFDLIFHLKSLSEHSGKIPVLVKNQGTFTLKVIIQVQDDLEYLSSRLVSCS